MGDGIGTLTDRIANRLVHHFPGDRFFVAPDVPIVTFSFDDAPENAWQVGADIIEKAGGRATYYIAGSLVGTAHDGLDFITEEGCAHLAARGHELGCHTFAHRKLASYSVDELEADLDKNAQFLTQFDQRTAPRNFAVPYIMANPFVQKQLAKRFLTSRGGHTGINRGLVDPFYLHTLELRPDTPKSDIQTALQDLEAQPGWLIFFTHDVSTTPTQFGFGQKDLAKLSGDVAARGFEIATIDQALQKLNVRQRLLGERQK